MKERKKEVKRGGGEEENRVKERKLNLSLPKLDRIECAHFDGADPTDYMPNCHQSAGVQLAGTELGGVEQ